MSYEIIDAHTHLWEELRGEIGEYKIASVGGGRANTFGEVRQMMPPYMLDGKNTAQMLFSNMDYAGVAGAVVTQEYLDGDQNSYLLEAKKMYPNRLKIFGLADFRNPGYFEEISMLNNYFDGIKVPAQRLIDLPKRVHLFSGEMMKVFKFMEEKNLILSIDLAEGDSQVGELEEVIKECPSLKIAIGHFGMVNRPKWQEQIKLARHENVMIESGGITWLFHKEFYPYVGAVEAIKEAIDIVGAEKLMWGSDYPRTMTAITYKMSFDFILKTNLLADEEKRLFLGANASKFYEFNNLPVIKQIKNIVED